MTACIESDFIHKLESMPEGNMYICCENKLHYLWCYDFDTDATSSESKVEKFHGYLL